MAHAVGTVEIEFVHDEDRDAVEILRHFLEEMMAKMSEQHYVLDPHYHILSPPRLTS